MRRKRKKYWSKRVVKEGATKVTKVMPIIVGCKAITIEHGIVDYYY